MNFLNIILVIILLSFLLYVIKKFASKRASIRKREDLVDSYKNELKNIIKKYSNNQNELKIKKLEYIKRVNNELSTNIFFDKNEVKKVIYELSNM